MTIIGPVPPQPFDVPRRMARAAAYGGPEDDSGESLADYRRKTGWFTANYARWQARGVGIVDPVRALAVGEGTRIAEAGVPLYFDSHHLSLAGARAVLAADSRR